MKKSRILEKAHELLIEQVMLKEKFGSKTKAETHISFIKEGMIYYKPKYQKVYNQIVKNLTENQIDNYTLDENGFLHTWINGEKYITFQDVTSKEQVKRIIKNENYILSLENVVL